MKINDKIVWNIILVVSIFLLVQGFMNVGDKDKKMAQAAQGEAAAGAVGVAAFVAKKAFPVWGIVLVFGAALPFILGQWKNLIFPPTIPSWVWIGALILLFFMITGRRR